MQPSVQFCLWHQRKRQQCRRRVLGQIGDMQKMHVRSKLPGNRQRIRDRF